MRAFAELFDQMDQTPSTNEKVEFMRAYFVQAPPADSAWALFFLSGHTLKRFITARKLMLWVQEVSALPEWLIHESYAAVGDTAETVALLLRPQEESSNRLSLAAWMEKNLLPLRTLDEASQKEKIIAYWQTLSSKEIFILNKILTGSLRVGVSHLLTLRALSQALNVPSEALSQRLMGNWEPTAPFFESLKSQQVVATELDPYPFYLASPLESPLETLGNPAEWLIEWKWDGIRGQAIRRAGKSALWSRGNELISAQFPELLDMLTLFPDGTVIDGEILAFAEGAPLSFNVLQKRLGRKKVSKALIEEAPVVLMVYDLLEFEGQDLRGLPLEKRREMVERWQGCHPLFQVSQKLFFQGWQEIEHERSQSRHRGTEGLMLKKWDSNYGVGRKRGAWWKYKVDPHTLDTVLMYAQAGQGRRANLYTDYTFGIWHEGELIPIAKAYSGLNQEEINELDHWIRRHTEEKFGPVRKVKAEQVFELSFEGIQLSSRHKSGVALRFPRINRWRKDKPAAECDTLESIKREFFNDR